MDVSTLSIETDPVSHKKIINNQYRIDKKIGQGQFGKVLLAEVIQGSRRPSVSGSGGDGDAIGDDASPSQFSTPTSFFATNHGNSKYVAIKTINRIERTKLITRTYLSHTSKIKLEITIMKSCNHPNVVKLYKVIDDLKFDKILLVLEYCQFGEIDWKTYNHYNEKHYKHGAGLTINRILRDVINGLDYLHRIKNIIHRDLKPLNLLIASDKTIKISDFGVSLILENNANDEKELGKSMGTPAFFAPELCQFVNNRFSMINDKSSLQKKIDNKIDLWSLGVILYCLVFHTLPFNGSNEFVLFKNIVTQNLQFPKIRHSTLATNDDMEELGLLKDLIKRLLTKEPLERIGIDGVKNHKFTTWDLSLRDKQEFIDYNKRYERRDSTNNSTFGKIKKFFGAPPQTQSNGAVINNSSTTPVDPSTLEPVDDLLDSYFDDSSSFGSIEEIEDSDEEYAKRNIIDTTNILQSVSSSSLSSKIKPKLSPIFIQQNSSNNTIYNNNNSNSITNNNNYNQNGNNSIASLSKPGSRTSPTLVSPATSISSTNSNIVTIGAGSPTIFKNMFSPSRRFFSKISNSKKANTTEPTINSLSSPNGGVNEIESYSDFKPPNFLGLPQSSSLGNGGNAVGNNVGNSSSTTSSRKIPSLQLTD